MGPLPHAGSSSSPGESSDQKTDRWWLRYWFARSAHYAAAVRFDVFVERVQRAPDVSATLPPVLRPKSFPPRLKDHSSRLTVDEKLLPQSARRGYPSRSIPRGLFRLRIPVQPDARPGASAPHAIDASFVQVWQ